MAPSRSAFGAFWHQAADIRAVAKRPRLNTDIKNRVRMFPPQNSFELEIASAYGLGASGFISEAPHPRIAKTRGYRNRTSFMSGFFPELIHWMPPRKPGACPLKSVVRLSFCPISFWGR